MAAQAQLDTGIKLIIELWSFMPQFQTDAKTSFHADPGEAGVYYL